MISPEILGWAIAILSAAWTEWVFTAKSNSGSKYQTDAEYINNRPRQAAAENVRLLVPYIRCSIMDTLDRAIQIGINKETNYHHGQKVAQATKSAVDKFFSFGVTKIQNECNNVARRYCALWNAKSSELMSEYHFQITYAQGGSEIQPDLVLSEPSTIRINVFNSYCPSNPSIEQPLYIPGIIR